MLAAVGRACDAERLIPVTSAHLVIDGTALGEPGLKLIERLVAAGGRFVIPVSINAIAVDRRATARGTLSDDQHTQLRLLEACEKMGCISSCSCNPFIQGFRPAFGESVAWSESATAPFVNSVLGARTNREGATALASALTGFPPAYGMHLAAERKARLLFDVTAEIAGLHRFNLLGALIGRRCDGRVSVDSRQTQHAASRRRRGGQGPRSPSSRRARSQSAVHLRSAAGSGVPAAVQSLWRGLRIRQSRR